MNDFTKGARVSQEMQQAGIPGIRYLDQGSRQAVELQNTLNMYKDRATQLRRENNPENSSFILAADNKVAELQKKIDSSTRNYVLFNDQLVDIMRKYGLAAPAAAGAASYAMGPQEAQAGKAQAAQFQQPAPLSTRINEIIDGLQWQDQWQGRMRLPLQNKVNTLLGESVWPPLR